MRIHHTMPDGRVLMTGSKSRYVCFRLTTFGGYACQSGRSAEDVVKWARRQWAIFGWHFVVIDTVGAELIAQYPAPA